MFGIRITSVFTWHFVYLTVFFSYFFSMAAITGCMIHSLLQEASDRAVRLLDWGEKKKSHCLSEAIVDSLNSPVFETGGLWRGHQPVLFLLSSLDGGVGRWGCCFCFFFFPFWHRLWWSRWSGTSPLFPQITVTWLKTETSGWCH